MLECSWKECVCLCMYFVSSILHFHFNLSWFFCFIFNVYYLKQKLSAIALPYKDKISIFQIPWSLSSASALTLHRHALWPPWHHSEIVWPFSVLSYFRYMFFLFFSLVWGFFLTLNFTKLFAQPSCIFSIICGICFCYVSRCFKIVFVSLGGGSSLFVQTQGLE